MTDNRNRTVADVRHAFSKGGGNLGTEGCVSFLFKKIGLISVLDIDDEDFFLEKVLESGADDIRKITANSFDVHCSPDSYFEVKDLFKLSGFRLANSEVTLIPTQEKKLNEKNLQQTAKMIDLLEDVDDVQRVYSNAIF